MEATGNARTQVVDRAELLHLAIQKLRQEEEEEDEEKRNKIFTSSQEEEEEDRRLLARLLSQLESRKDDNIDQSELSTETKALISSGPEGASAKDDKGSEGADIGMEEIVKELRVIRKQNTVTHWLLSVLIVVTAVWQMSEVSLLLYLKDSVKHPFKAIGGLITGSLGCSNEYDATKSNSSSKQHQIESIPLPHQMKMSELLSMEMSSLDLNGQNQD
ncbi:hypothetical protein MRB53_027513 [Persea americana]|uniref:Uncharacterized protein n=1 Tax=Persea americana TaxID=3435 RepID=A0ACC2LLB0_PERAE|nr:hypothetical protein MRB53_027513 [Persea americana]|eukprot:TRINITY_DN336_c0_g1_i4.p1 TRINITY_DN336_c0_g1~~TRINITY_DN336_c0_g1_i4.p1  ORF type:complete len:217 (-),score=58.03 TRINITY_DN336_c0_g1_i4:719-1369(-)